MKLKFRAWHKERKVYINHEELFNLDCSNEFPFLALISGHYIDEGMDVIIEQYLEYDEHNKRDVYVGDIYWNDRCQDYFIVIRNEEHHAVGYSWIYDNSIDLNWEGISIDNRYVGNVHENKELLD